MSKILAVNNAPNIYWHGQIKNIKSGVSQQGLRWAILECYGKCSMRDTLNPEGTLSHYQSMDVYAVSGLADYVEAELYNGDSIFVVGYAIAKRAKAGPKNFFKLCCQAEYIYKEDCLKFYK